MSKANVDIIDNSVFTQECPHHVCQNDGMMKRLARQCGYKRKCRDPRCSLACLKAWHEQEKALLLYLWQEKLPEGMRSYRGNLTMPPGATLDDHRKVRGAFLRTLKRHAERAGIEIRLRAYSDYIGPSDLHYDVVAYASETIGVERLANMVRDAWLAAGGKRSTFRPLDEGQRAAWSVYTTKARGIKDKRRYRFVPAKGSLPYTFGTNGFYTMSRAALWRELCKIWHPTMLVAKVSDSHPTPIDNKEKIDTTKCVPETHTLPNDPVTQAARRAVERIVSGEVQGHRFQADLPFAKAMERLAEEAPIVIVEDRPTYTPPDTAAQLRRLLPRDPAKARPFADLADQLGWSGAELQEAIILAQRQGHKVRFTGKGRDLAYYLGTG